MNYRDKKQYAESLISEDNYAEALRVYSDIRRDNSNDVDVFEKMIFLTTKILEGNYDFEPETGEQFAMRGVAKFYHNEIDGALIDLNKAIELEPDSHYAYHSRGLVNRIIGNFKESIYDLEMAIKIKPIANYYDELGTSYSGFGDRTKTLAAHKMAVSLDPDEPIYWYNYGFELIGSKQLEEALEMFNKAIELNPNYEDAIVNRDYVLKILKTLRDN